MKRIPLSEPDADIPKDAERRRCDASRFLLQKLSAGERKKAVADKIEERKKIRVQILELSKKRDAFIREERKRLSAKSPVGFDEAVSAALKAQIASKGLKP